MSKRSAFWDNYKGILIFLVVFGHFIYSYATKCDGSWANTLFTFIYMFHMPAFIFVSGYFSKSKNTNSPKSLLKLLFYYLVFNFGMMFFLNIYKGTSLDLLTPYNSYWYILSLIFWRISIKPLSKIKGILPLSIIISLLLGYWSFPNLLSIRRTVAFFPFFLMGYKFEKAMLDNLLSKRTIKKSIIYFILIALISLCIIMVIHNNNPFTLSMLLMGTYQHAYEVIYRIIIFIVATMAILGMLFTVFQNEVPILTKIGRNSLLIYLVHRFITIIFYNIFTSSDYSGIFIIYSFIASIVLCLLFSTNKLNNIVNSIFDKGVELVMTKNIAKSTLVFCFVMLLALKPIKIFYDSVQELVSNEEVIINEEKDNFIKISYVGDLILLKNQVTSAYDDETGKYDFKPMFEYVKPYFEDADYAIGVFEGPSAGTDRPYSTSNYGDGIKLYLNFPDEFAEAVKWSGIDYVTTANNHLLDCGEKGAIRTLDVLDKVGLDHSGSYRDEKEKDTLSVVDVDGVKIAILSYASSVNYYNNEALNEELPYITSIIPKEDNKYYDELVEEIEEDFEQAKDAKVDLIIVMAHMGTQFKHTTNDFQDKWNKKFAELGADIILGDHAHAVQPIEYIDSTLVINCPGNFANSYNYYDGDATAIANIYIDKTSKKVVASSIVPMYTQEMKKGYFRALPIYDIINNKDLYEELSADEMLRVSEVKNLVLDVMINQKVTFDDNRKEYYFIENDFYKNMTPLWELNTKYQDNQLYQLINEANSVTFIGDSITEGTKNNLQPWYLPLMSGFRDKKITNISKGSYTTLLMLNTYEKEILKSNSDVYVIALGTNDVRYRNKKNCAMTSEQYIENIEKIIKLIHQSNEDAKIVLIAPWMTLDNDQISKLPPAEKDAMIDEYSEALKQYSIENEILYINPNPYLRDFFEDKDYSNYMIDDVHPNEFLGIFVYSEAVLASSV